MAEEMDFQQLSHHILLFFSKFR